MIKSLGIARAEGRGFYGHKGIPGHRGGSAPSSVGRRGISGGDRMLITHIVGNLHVGTSNRGVIRTVAGKIKNFGKQPKSIRRAVMKTALKAHASNQGIYKLVQRGW